MKTFVIVFSLILFFQVHGFAQKKASPNPDRLVSKKQANEILDITGYTTRINGFVGAVVEKRGTDAGYSEQKKKQISEKLNRKMKKYVAKQLTKKLKHSTYKNVRKIYKSRFFADITEYERLIVRDIFSEMAPILRQEVDSAK